MTKTSLKEKDIVNKIVSSWEEYFPDLTMYKTEWKFRNFRVDIAAGFDIELSDIGRSDTPKICHAPVFFEVKYNSEMRDLIFELEKQLAFRDFYNIDHFSMICVISDKFDKTMELFMIKNNIDMFLINIDNDDIDTLTLSPYYSELIIPKEIVE